MSTLLITVIFRKDSGNEVKTDSSQSSKRIINNKLSRHKKKYMEMKFTNLTELDLVNRTVIFYIFLDEIYFAELL